MAGTSPLPGDSAMAGSSARTIDSPFATATGSARSTWAAPARWSSWFGSVGRDSTPAHRTPRRPSSGAQNPNVPATRKAASFATAAPPRAASEGIRVRGIRSSSFRPFMLPRRRHLPRLSITEPPVPHPNRDSPALRMAKLRRHRDRLRESKNDSDIPVAGAASDAHAAHTIKSNRQLPISRIQQPVEKVTAQCSRLREHVNSRENMPTASVGMSHTNHEMSHFQRAVRRRPMHNDDRAPESRKAA